MENNELINVYQTYTDESNMVIKIDELIEYIKDLPIDEQNDALKYFLSVSDKLNKDYCEQIKRNESQRNCNVKKRKVVAVKKITQSQKEYFNDVMKSYEGEIKSLISFDLNDFECYIKNQNDFTNINYYILGLIKELVAYNRLADDAYLSKDNEMIIEIKNYIEMLNTKLSILKEMKNTLMQGNQKLKRRD